MIEVNGDQSSATPPVSRESVRELLGRWQDGSMNERQVHEAAEGMYERYGDEPPIYADDDARSITLEAVSQLSILNWQLITPRDIPAFFAFLATSVGKESSAWETWKRYWDAVDFEQRMRDLADNQYYAKTPRPTDRPA